VKLAIENQIIVNYKISKRIIFQQLDIYDQVSKI